MRDAPPEAVRNDALDVPSDDRPDLRAACHRRAPSSSPRRVSAAGGRNVTGWTGQSYAGAPRAGQFSLRGSATSFIVVSNRFDVVNPDLLNDEEENPHEVISAACLLQAHCRSDSGTGGRRSRHRPAGRSRGRAGAPAAASAADHLILDYDFDGAGSVSATVQDTSGDGRNGTLVNPVRRSSSTVRAAERPCSSPAGRALPPQRRTSRSPRVCSRTCRARRSRRGSSGRAVEVFEWLYTLGKDRNNATFYTPKFETARPLQRQAHGGRPRGRCTGDDAPPHRRMASGHDDRRREQRHLLPGRPRSQPYQTSVSTWLRCCTKRRRRTRATSVSPSGPGCTLLQGGPRRFPGLRHRPDAAAGAGIWRDRPPRRSPRSSRRRRRCVPMSVRHPHSRACERRTATAATSGLRHLGRRARTAYASAVRSPWRAPSTETDTIVTAKVRVVIPGELSIDAADRTGAFMGGASGTLYGLYGPGLPSEQSHRRHPAPHRLDQGAGRAAAPRCRRARGREAARRLLRRRRVHLHDRHQPRLPLPGTGNTGAEKEAWYKQSVIDQ